MARDKLVLAYSGGLDTSVAVKWINETYDMDVIAYTCDLGQGQDIQAIRQKALRTGAVDAIAEDARNLFIDYFVWSGVQGLLGEVAADRDGRLAAWARALDRLDRAVRKGFKHRTRLERERGLAGVKQTFAADFAVVVARMPKQ